MEMPQVEGHKKPTGPPAHLSASVSPPCGLWHPGEGSQEGTTHSLVVASPLPHAGGAGRPRALDPQEQVAHPPSLNLLLWSPPVRAVGLERLGWRWL